MGFTVSEQTAPRNQKVPCDVTIETQPLNGRALVIAKQSNQSGDQQVGLPEGDAMVVACL